MRRRRCLVATGFSSSVPTSAKLAELCGTPTLHVRFRRLASCKPGARDDRLASCSRHSANSKPSRQQLVLPVPGQAAAAWRDLWPQPEMQTKTWNASDQSSARPTAGAGLRIEFNTLGGQNSKSEAPCSAPCSAHGERHDETQSHTRFPDKRG